MEQTQGWNWTNKLISDSDLGLELFAELAPAILLLFLVIDCLRLLVHNEQPDHAKVQPEAGSCQKT